MWNRIGIMVTVVAVAACEGGPPPWVAVDAAVADAAPDPPPIEGCAGNLACDVVGGGSGCFVAPMQVTVREGGAAADWSCMAGAASTLAGVTSIGGTVRDLQNSNSLVATVALYAAPDAAALAQTTSNGSGVWTVSVPAGSSTDLHARVSATDYLDTWIEHLALAPALASQTRDLRACSAGLATALPAIIGVVRTPGTALLTGTVRDCSSAPIRNAIVTVTTAPGTVDGCPSFVAGALAFYVDAEAGLPVRRDQLDTTDEGGRFFLLEIAPSGAAASQNVQVWGYPTEAHLALGAPGLTLLAEAPAWTFADSVTLLDPPANQGPITAP